MRRLLVPLLSGPLFTVASIIIGNLIPVFGVAFLGWDGAQILVLYWVENLILGVVTLPRILSARGAAQPETKGELNHPVGAGCFFIVHYGLFCIAHAVFTFMLAADLARSSGDGQLGVLERTLGHSGFWWAVLAIAVIQLVIQVREWWLPKAWLGSTPSTEMFQTYGRVFVLHFTVLVGAWLMSRFEAPTSAILLLCLAKAALELLTWRWSQSRSIAEPDAGA